MTIDIHVLAGLAAKLTEIYGADGLDLCFPTTPEMFTTADLAHLGAGLSADSLPVLARFSQLVDCVPSGDRWLADPTRRLSDAYDRILRESELAISDRTPQEDDALATALALLYVRDGDGLLEPSALLQRYRQLRDAVYQAQAEQRNRAGEAALAGGQALEQWNTVDGPEFERQIDALAAEWEGQGERSRIEAAQDVERRLAARSPIRTWAELRRQYDPAIDELEDPILGGYLPAWFTPSNIADGPAWPTITVSGSDLQTLAAAAPSAFASGLTSLPTAVATPRQVSFEYAAVTVSRRWFSPVAFESRGWRLNALVSDGNEPGSGLCPSYIIAAILVRNVQVTSDATVNPTVDPDREQPVHPSHSLPWFTEVQPRKVYPRLMEVVTQPPHSLPGQAIFRQPRHAQGRPFGTGGAVVLPQRPQPVLERLRGADYASRRLNLERVVQPPTRGTTTATPPDQIYVLAVLAKRTPLAPNPDPDFTWPSS